MRRVRREADIRWPRPSWHLLVFMDVAVEAFAQRVDPNFANPFEVVGAPRALDFDIDRAHMADRIRDSRDGGLAAPRAFRPLPFLRIKILDDSLHHFGAVCEEPMLSARERFSIGAQYRLGRVDR